MATILKGNLHCALMMAIELRKKQEKHCSADPNFKSGLLQGWEDIIEAIEDGEEVKVK